MKHIPAPWWFRKATDEEKVTHLPNETVIHSPSGSWIGNFGSAGNTEFMIKAVNAHEDLASLLLESHFAHKNFESSAWGNLADLDWITRVRETLTKQGIL